LCNRFALSLERFQHFGSHISPHIVDVRLQFPLWFGLCLLEGWHARHGRSGFQAISDWRAH
jgi:hypothetical protein